MAFILIGAAAGSAVFAYVTGSSLYFIRVAGLQPQQYGMIFSACSAAVMFGTFLDGQLGPAGIAPADVLTVGLMLLFVASSTMLVTTLADLSPPALVTSLLMVVALAFGLSMPNLTNATMQPLPDIAGAVSAAAGSIQLGSGAIASGLVAPALRRAQRAVDGRRDGGDDAVGAGSIFAICPLCRTPARNVRPPRRPEGTTLS